MKKLTLLSLVALSQLYSVQAHAAPSAPTLSPTVSSSYQPVNQNFNVNITEVTGATFYKLYDNDTLVSDTTSTLSTSFSYSAIGYHKYDYQACDASGCSSLSPQRQIWVYEKPWPDTGLTVNPASVTIGQPVNISWIRFLGGADGATYTLTFNGNPVCSRKRNSWADYSFDCDHVPSENGTYSLLACNPNNFCADPITQSVAVDIPTPAIPTNLSSDDGNYIAAKENNHTIRWDSVSYASSYQVYFDGSVYTVSSNSWSMPVNGENHYDYIQVLACNSNQQCSSLSPELRVWIYAQTGAPEQLAASPSTVPMGSTTTISWHNAYSAVPGATYVVTRSDNKEVCRVTKANSQHIDYSCPDTVGRSNVSYSIVACNPGYACGPASTINISVTVPTFSGLNIERFLGNTMAPELFWQVQNALPGTIYEVYNPFDGQVYTSNGISSVVGETTALDSKAQLYLRACYNNVCTEDTVFQYKPFNKKFVQLYVGYFSQNDESRPGQKLQQWTTSDLTGLDNVTSYLILPTPNGNDSKDTQQYDGNYLGWYGTNYVNYLNDVKDQIKVLDDVESAVGGSQWNNKEVWISLPSTEILNQFDSTLLKPTDPSVSDITAFINQAKTVLANVNNKNLFVHVAGFYIYDENLTKSHTCSDIAPADYSGQFTPYGSDGNCWVNLAEYYLPRIHQAIVSASPGKRLMHIPYQGVYSSVDTALQQTFPNYEDYVDYVLLQPSAYQLTANSSGNTPARREAYLKNVQTSISTRVLHWLCQYDDCSIPTGMADHNPTPGGAPVAQTLQIGGQFEMDVKITRCSESLAQHKLSEQMLKQYIGKTPMTFYAGVRESMYVNQQLVFEHLRIANDLYGGTEYVSPGFVDTCIYDYVN